jgi:hypothetical protein
MTINSRRDLITAIDNGQWDTENDWLRVMDALASMIRDLPDCPDYGTDWTGFLNGLNWPEMVIMADDSLSA